MKQTLLLLCMCFSGILSALTDDEKLLLVAAKNNDFQSVKDLVSRQVCVNASDPADKMTPLMHAVVNKNCIMIEYLIDNGSNVNARNFQGSTCLGHAVTSCEFSRSKDCYSKIIRMLIILAAADITVLTHEQRCLGIVSEAIKGRKFYVGNYCGANIEGIFGQKSALLSEIEFYDPSHKADRVIELMHAQKTEDTTCGCLIS